ncbi:uncharacterized protein EV420DRAFT_1649869 [Desarmillaria tabescens]|uniref:Uncharacterized protein n=1 Tax=Armillaria tabescens TaxID=1929756 RepID=A0AA39MNZ4_ARMTA|nr:uncharacterized protein EV420DRAFT_1649869 [Desarmillaria tabescens]KAK0441751.1 hypothetical protein EV420DRAFT_1649869 [Desarmillaria tabescens]
MSAPHHIYVPDTPPQASSPPLMQPPLPVQPPLLMQPTPPAGHTPTNHISFTPAPASGFPKVQGWTKDATWFNLSSTVETSRTNITMPKCYFITGNPDIMLSPPVLTRGKAYGEKEPYTENHINPFLFCLSNITEHEQDSLLSQRCWSSDIITFFAITTNPKPYSYLLMLHKLTYPDTDAGAEGVCKVVRAALRHSPNIRTFITTNRDALSSTLTTDEALEVVVSSVRAKKLDIIVTAGRKERTWAIYAKPPTDMFNFHWPWRNLIVSLPFDAAIATHGVGIPYPKDHRCNICYAVDHPTPLCPFPLILGWHGPSLLTNSRATETKEEPSALQVLDIHHTPAQDNRGG